MIIVKVPKSSMFSPAEVAVEDFVQNKDGWDISDFKFVLGDNLSVYGLDADDESRLMSNIRYLDRQMGSVLDRRVPEIKATWGFKVSRNESIDYDSLLSAAHEDGHSIVKIEASIPFCALHEQWVFWYVKEGSVESKIMHANKNNLMQFFYWEESDLDGWSRFRPCKNKDVEFLHELNLLMQHERDKEVKVTCF